MTEQYTIKDVTKDLAALLSLTKVFTVDEKGFWYDWEAGKRFVYKMDANDAGHEIVNFQDPLPEGEHLFFNPFAEGMGRKSPAVTFYYRTIRIALNYNISKVMLHVARTILAIKEAAKNNETHSLPHIVARMSSVMIDRKVSVYDVIDDKIAEEFNRLFDRMDNDWVNVPYMSNQATAMVKSAVLTDDKWDEKYGKDIRKKTLLTFKAVLMGVLGINNPEELRSFSTKYDSSLKSSPQFHTTLETYLKLYTRFNDVLADAFSDDGVPLPNNEIDLGELAGIIDRLPLAYAIAKHMFQPVLPNVSAISTQTSDTSGLRIGGPAPGAPGASRFQPQVVDSLGRVGFNQPLQLGGLAPAQGRFMPQVVSDAPMDPFAPATKPSSGGLPAGGIGGGFTSFTGQGSMFGNGGGLNVSSPSNFGSPGMRRYF